MATNGEGAARRDQTSDLQLLVDSTPSLIHTSRPDGYFDFFNQTWLRYIGQPLEDLQGWKWTAFIHPEDVEAIVEKWRASPHEAGCCITRQQCPTGTAKLLHGMDLTLEDRINALKINKLQFKFRSCRNFPDFKGRREMIYGNQRTLS